MALSLALAVVLSGRLSVGAGGTYPALKVEFAPGVASSAVPAGGDWVDLSARVLGFSSKWGREDEFSQPGAGTMTLTLDNSDGELDPDNSSGTYYGDLLPLMWFRLTGGTATANTGVFYGQVSIDGFKLSASQFEGAVDVTVDVLDGLEQLANTDAPGSVYAIEVEADSPAAWWRLGESSGSVASDASGNENDGTYEGGATFNARAALIAGEQDGAIEFSGNEMGVDVPASIIDAYPFTIEAWFVTDAVGALNQFVYQAEGAFAGTVSDSIVVAIGGTSGVPAVEGEAYLAVSNSSGVERVVSTGVRVDDNTIHHLVVVANDATDFEVWLDGTEVSTVEATGSPTVASYSVATIGNTSGVVAGSIYAPFVGTLDEVAVYDAALSGARILAHYNAGSDPWADELTSARVTHILDAVGWPSTLRTIETGQTTMPAAELGGTDALSLLQEIATAEGGRVYIDHQDSGKLRFEDRHERWTAARSITSQATFGDGGGSEVPYSSVDLQDDQIINSVAAQRFGGSTIVVEDATSQTTYQERDYSLTGLLTTSDSEVRSRAAALVAEKKDRHRRVRSMVLEPRGDSHPAWAQVFARRVGDRVTVKWRPPYGGTYSFPCWIEGIAHDWTQAEARWRTTFWLSPVPYDGSGSGYWILGTSTLGTDTRPGW